MNYAVIVKASNGPRYVVGCRRQVSKFSPLFIPPPSLPLPLIFLVSFPLPPISSLSQLDKSRLKQGSRVSLDMTTLTIMRQLPREVDPLVFNMSIEDPGDVFYSSVGGLSEQIRELREVGGWVGGNTRGAPWNFVLSLHR